MARGNHSTFKDNLPVLKEFNVAAWSWGLVNGKSNTIFPWDSWKKHYTGEPTVWFHDILRADGTPFSTAEVKLIRNLCGKGCEPEFCGTEKERIACFFDSSAAALSQAGIRAYPPLAVR